LHWEGGGRSSIKREGKIEDCRRLESERWGGGGRVRSEGIKEQLYRRVMLPVHPGKAKIPSKKSERGKFALD